MRGAGDGTYVYPSRFSTNFQPINYSTPVGVKYTISMNAAKMLKEKKSTEKN